MGESLPALRRADRRDHDVIIGPIDAAAEWLQETERIRPTGQALFSIQPPGG